MEKKIIQRINLQRRNLNNFSAASEVPSHVELANYPWDQCIADQTERYGDEETAKRICGSIKALYGSKIDVKENFVIPQPEGGEDENAFISRCVSDISGEYDQEQALGICYSVWEKS